MTLFNEGCHSYLLTWDPCLVVIELGCVSISLWRFSACVWLRVLCLLSKRVVHGCLERTNFQLPAQTKIVSWVFAVKPPIEELQYFLEFQTPIQWSPTGSDLGLGPQRKEPVFPVIQFSLMGPKLYINTTQVSEQYRWVVHTSNSFSTVLAHEPQT
jgi:hypothetical protein